MRTPLLTAALVGALGLALAACTSPAPAPAPAPTAARPALTATSAVDLARELDAAEELGSWQAVRERWQGQVVRWTVTRQRALCRSAEACHVAAFPVPQPARRGWLPALAFAPGEFAALEAACAGRDACEVVIEGTLARLEASGELPTSVRFTGVRVVGGAS